MVNNNKQPEDDGCENGSFCRLVKLKIKANKKPSIQKFDAWKVNSISISDVEYLLCEHWEYKDNEPRRFKVFPQQFIVQIKTQNMEIKNIKIMQFGINNNTATTGHKLQGMSKDSLFTVDYDYGTENWIYVLLSRVNEMKGYFSYKQLDINKLRKPDKDLLKDQKRLQQIEKKTLEFREKMVIKEIITMNLMKTKTIKMMKKSAANVLL